MPDRQEWSDYADHLREREARAERANAEMRAEVATLKADRDALVREHERLREALVIDEGEGLSSHLYRCRLCFKGWRIGGLALGSGEQHAPGCPLVTTGVSR